MKKVEAWLDAPATMLAVVIGAAIGVIVGGFACAVLVAVTS